MRTFALALVFVTSTLLTLSTEAQQRTIVIEVTDRLENDRFITAQLRETLPTEYLSHRFTSFDVSVSDNGLSIMGRALATQESPSDTKRIVRATHFFSFSELNKARVNRIQSTGLTSVPAAVASEMHSNLTNQIGYFGPRHELKLQSIEIDVKNDGQPGFVRVVAQRQLKTTSGFKLGIETFIAAYKTLNEVTEKFPAIRSQSCAIKLQQNFAKGFETQF